ncbi:hypothetical protein Tco_0725381 [Tanacetum coccineum]|uniref:Uncharacterized protein n=1 Tax=Tanacetum coccineum TaxID=301880 RepID=A0ABQ4YDG9_9ASTR
MVECLHLDLLLDNFPLLKSMDRLSIEMIVMDTLFLLSSSDAGYEMEDVADNVGDVSLEDIIASVELVGNEDC